jgi:16S rRNA (guanine1207-N2)-methyltransferase
MVHRHRVLGRLSRAIFRVRVETRLSRPIAMPASKPGYVNDRYRIWGTETISVANRPVMVASKPGVFAHGSVDPSSLLLAEYVRAEPGHAVVHMNCGNGLLGATLALADTGARVILTDRNVVAIEAATQTLSANGVHVDALHLGHGSFGLSSDLAADVVAIRIPHEKLALLQLLHDAFAILKVGGRCYVAGATNEGIKSAARIAEGIFGNVATIAAEGGHRVLRADKTAEVRSPNTEFTGPYLHHDVFSEQMLTLRGNSYLLSSRPGVFSWDHLDEATAILVEQMDVRADDRVLDMGCGYGVLGVVAGSIANTHPVTMIDADSEAVRSAAESARSAGLSNARILASDVASAVLEEQFDLVVTNPPFHVGKSTDLSVPIQFIYDAWTVLAPGGRLTLVANRTLPYEGAIKFLFKNITKEHDGRRFKVLSAVKGP